MSLQNDPQDTAEYIPFEEFRNGLPQGRFRVIVDPKLAAPFVAHRTHVTPLAIAMSCRQSRRARPWGGIRLFAGPTSSMR